MSSKTLERLSICLFVVYALMTLVDGRVMLIHRVSDAFMMGSAITWVLAGKHARETLGVK